MPHAAAKSNTVKSETTLEMRRIFNVSKERLYEAWTTPNLVAQWFHPAETMTTTVSELSVQPGGRYRFIMHGDGEHIIGGVYQEVVPMEKLVFTWKWESEEETSEMLITISFNVIDEKRTELVLLHERFPQTKERDSHEWGWNGTLDGLERAI